MMTVVADFAPLQAVGTILTPVVIVTSAAILVNGMLSMYASVNDRMRSMVSERLQLLGPDLLSPPGARDEERLNEIDRQLPRLLRRHRLLRDAALLTYTAIVAVVVSMFLVAIAETAGVAWVATAALWVLLAGTLVLAGGLLQTVRAVRSSDDAVAIEVRRVLGLARREDKAFLSTEGLEPVPSHAVRGPIKSRSTSCPPTPAPTRHGRRPR